MAAGRLDILTAVKTALEGITTGNGYHQTVKTVERIAKGWAELAPGEKPWMGYWPGREVYEYQLSHRIRCTFTLWVVGHVAHKTVADRYTYLERLSDDTIRALRQSVVRAGCAESITLKSTETDEGSAEAFNEGSILMEFDIVYYRNEPTS